MHSIRITEHARSDIENIAEYTRQHWGTRQEIAVQKLLAHAFRFIATHPKAGHKTEIANTYTRVIARLPFVVVYEVHDKEIVIAQIIHARRKRNLKT